MSESIGGMGPREAHAMLWSAWQYLLWKYGENNIVLREARWKVVESDQITVEFVEWACERAKVRWEEYVPPLQPREPLSCKHCGEYWRNHD